MDAKEIIEQSSPKQESPGVIWIENLKLTKTDKATIEKGEKFDDKVIDAAQSLLKRNYYPVEGLDSTLLV